MHKRRKIVIAFCLNLVKKCGGGGKQQKCGAGCCGEKKKI